MELTRDCRITIKARMARDPEFVDAMLDQQDELIEENEQLREIAKAVYGNWACGEPVDEGMKELGEALGFKVDVP